MQQTVRKLFKPSSEIIIGNLHTSTIILSQPIYFDHSVASTLFKPIQLTPLIPTGQDVNKEKNAVSVTILLMVEYSTAYLQYYCW